MQPSGIQIDNTPNIIVITDSDANQITVTQPITSVIEVATLGPQGPVGPQGPAGPTGSFDSVTGSFTTTASFNAFTASYNTASFTGSFIGSGAGLYNIPASGITGLNLTQIATGSVSASVSLGTGSFTVNSGSSNFLFISSSGNIGIGTTTPTASLHISGSSGSVLLKIDSPALNNTLYVSGSGRVGIGTNALSATLNVVTPYSSLNTDFTFSNADTTNAPASLSYSSFASILRLSKAYSSLRITNFAGTSDVAILSSSGPAGTLQLNQNGGSANVSLDGINGGTSYFLTNVGFGSSTSLGARLGIKGSGTTSSTTALLVQNANASSSLAVLDNGFVGINTGSAAYNLDVNGTARASALILTAFQAITLSNNSARFISDQAFMRIKSIGALDMFNLTDNFVGINATSTIPSAIFAITSADRGFLPPRTNLTSNISSPAQGLQTYITSSTTEGIWYYNSGSYQGWTRVLNNSGSQAIAGSLTLTGALTASSAVISGDVIIQGTASVNTLVVNQTQLSTGSNQLGDAANDFQTLYGTVRIPTGSLTVSGSTTIASVNGVGGVVITHDGSDTYFGSTGTNNSFRFNKNVLPFGSFSLGTYSTRWNGVYSSYFFPQYGTAVNPVYAFDDGIGNAIRNGMFGGVNFLGFSVSGSQQIGIGVGTTSITGSAIIKGSGATSSTTSLLVQNSTGTAALQVADNGNTSLGSPNFNDRLEVYGNILVRANDRIRLAGTTDGNTALYANSATSVQLNVRSSLGGTFDVTFGSIASNTRMFRINSLDSATPGIVIGSNATAVASALITAESTTQGFLLPRTNLTSNISTPAQGLQTYITASATEGLYYYNSGSYQGWTRVLNNSGSQAITGSLTLSNILTLTPQDPLPTGVATGSFAVSSSVPPKPYFYDGTSWNVLY